MGIDSHLQVCEVFGVVTWARESFLVDVADGLQLGRREGSQILQWIQTDKVRLSRWVGILISSGKLVFQGA